MKDDRFTLSRFERLIFSIFLDRHHWFFTIGQNLGITVLSFFNFSHRWALYELSQMEFFITKLSINLFWFFISEECYWNEPLHFRSWIKSKVQGTVSWPREMQYWYCKISLNEQGFGCQGFRSNLRYFVIFCIQSQVKLSTCTQIYLFEHMTLNRELHTILV